MNFSVKLYCKVSSKSKKGCPIYYIVSLNGKRRALPSKKYIDEEQFDNEKGLVVKHPSKIKLNASLAEEKLKLENIYLDLERAKLPITFESIFKRFNTDNFDSFIEYCEQKLHDERKNMEFKTWEGYKNNIKYLKGFMPDITFNDMSVSLLKKYDAWLKNEKKLESRNSRYQAFSTIRKFLNIAISEGLTDKYPFKEFSFKGDKGNKEFLLENERNALYSLFKENKLSPKLQKTLGNYLFSTNTGIPFDDLIHMEERIEFTPTTVYYRRGKTQEPIKIPMTDMAKELVEFVKNNPLKKKRHRVHEDLGEIMHEAGIHKKITFHTARNTFAVIAMMRGVNIKVIQRILGHTSVTTTEIYLKTLDQFVEEEVEKLNLNQDKEFNHFRQTILDVFCDVLEIAENEALFKYGAKLEKEVKRKWLEREGMKMRAMP
jgi:site-specific recombinase XerD